MGTSELEQPVAKIMWVLSTTHRFLAPFYYFFHRKFWLVYADEIIREL